MSISNRNAGKYGPEKFRLRARFTQCQFGNNLKWLSENQTIFKDLGSKQKKIFMSEWARLKLWTKLALDNQFAGYGNNFCFFHYFVIFKSMKITFPQSLHTRKLGKITVFYVVAIPSFEQKQMTFVTTHSALDETNFFTVSSSSSN